MWLDNLKELKKTKGMTYEQISEASKTPLSTVKRIFQGDSEPLASTLHRIAAALDGSLDYILADTTVVLSPQTLVEVKENAEAVEAEKEVIEVKNDMLEAKVAALTLENELLKKELQHKDELLAVYNYFTKIKTTE